MAVLSVLPAALAADMSRLPPPDPPGTVAVVTTSDATTTSRCIGQASTPVCAMETLLACHARDDERLCAQVDPNIAAGLREYPNLHPRGHTTTTRYRIRSVVTLGPDDGDKLVVPDLPMLRYPWQPGDVLIKLEKQSDDWAIRFMGMHLFHHDGDHWVLVGAQIVPPPATP